MLITLAMLATASISMAADQPESLRMIETSTSFANQMVIENPDTIRLLGNKSSNTALILVSPDDVVKLARRSHELTGRCGGFLDVTGETFDLRTLAEDEADLVTRPRLPALDEKNQDIVIALREISGKRVEGFVKAYSTQFKTRYCRHEEGIKAPEWLKAQWERMARDAGRDDIHVELMPPPAGYKQPSVRITLMGESQDAPLVIIGAHLDSINQRGGATAPGADDDASGIGAITEIYRELLARDAHGKATIQIFGYAAEEVGLLGSRSIAEKYREKSAKVIGVMQLDMVAWPADAKAVTFITDNVDKELTLWTEQLFGLYIGGSVQHEACGYGCSDHASWNRYGFKAVMPFESKMNVMNPRIHTDRDLWDDQLDAEYAAKFAKLGYAFVAELARVK